jgi:glycosyltransferase involved in cell wall biosynthesis
MSASVYRLHGQIETPRPLRAHQGKVLITGWCLDEALQTAPQVRLTAETAILSAKISLERRDVSPLFPHHPAASRCGFIIEGHLPPGVYLARFEALSKEGSWQCFQSLSLAVERVSFMAVIDEPISEGVLRDRVHVGGWALQPGETLSELTLRYGHRELSCKLNLPRQDVPALFPDVANAASAGFETWDHLVAGHGQARLRGKTADDRVVIARTAVTFSIATDENHSVDLNLTAPRATLGDRKSVPSGSPPSYKTARPLNILFVLPGSFASNSALHVAALANELAATGNTCIVAVSHDPETLAHHDRPAFRGVTHAEAKRGISFANGRGPDLIHAWTTRENVRALTQVLAARHHSRVVVHLEDNEQEILAFSLGRSFQTLENLPSDELDRLVPADLSHPKHSKEFLANSDGVTVITDRLREFVPADRPSLILNPAADARYFFPRPIPSEFRQILDVAAGTTVIFYHGNVHASNAAEVRDLYAAVLQLNREGHAVTLLRTGLDRVDFLGALSSEVAQYVLDLGQIIHHRHLPSLMALADIFVQPGRPDSFNDYRFPSKLPEFFAIGRPVVLPRTNLGLTLRHGIDAYLLDEADAKGIAGAIVELRRDSKLCARLSQGAAAFAAEHFSWKRSAEALAKFYAALTV